MNFVDKSIKTIEETCLWGRLSPTCWFCKQLFTSPSLMFFINPLRMRAVVFPLKFLWMFCSFRAALFLKKSLNYVRISCFAFKVFFQVKRGETRAKGAMSITCHFWHLVPRLKRAQEWFFDWQTKTKQVLKRRKNKESFTSLQNYIINNLLVG
jgi:hypothetical protein